MENFDLRKYLSEGRLLKEEIDLEKSLAKDVSGFRADLSKAMSDKKVKAVLDAGLADGSDKDDKLPYISTKIAVKKLIPTQNEIGFDQSVKGDLDDEYNSLSGIFKGTPNMGSPIVTYAGKYIIDGHHRWSTVFAVNPGANMDALDIKPKAGFQPTDILKAVHTAIAVELDKVPSADPEGINIMGGVDYKTVLEKVNEFLNDKAAKIWAENGHKTKEEIAKLLTKNLNLIAKQGHVSGAPGRKDMPQSDANKTKPEDKLKALATGKINIAPPFEKGEGGELKENKMKNFDLKKYLAENKLLKEDVNGIEFVNKFNPPSDVIEMYNENPHLKKPLSSYSRYKKNKVLAALATYLSQSQAKKEMVAMEDWMKSSDIDMIEVWADDYYKDSDFFSYGKYMDKDYFEFFNINKDRYLDDDREELPNWMDKY